MPFIHLMQKRATRFEHAAESLPIYQGLVDKLAKNARKEKKSAIEEALPQYEEPKQGVKISWLSDHSLFTSAQHKFSFLKMYMDMKISKGVRDARRITKGFYNKVRIF